MARAQWAEASEGCIYAAQKQPYLTALGSHSKSTMLSIFPSHVHAAGEYGTADLYRVSRAISHWDSTCHSTGQCCILPVYKSNCNHVLTAVCVQCKCAIDRDHYTR